MVNSKNVINIKKETQLTAEGHTRLVQIKRLLRQLSALSDIEAEVRNLYIDNYEEIIESGETIEEFAAIRKLETFVRGEFENEIKELRDAGFHTSEKVLILSADLIERKKRGVYTTFGGYVFKIGEKPVLFICHDRDIVFSEQEIGKSDVDINVWGNFDEE